MPVVGSDPERTATTDDAIGRADALILFVDSSGLVSHLAGGFAPSGMTSGTLSDVLGAEGLQPGLVAALVRSIAARTATTVEVTIGGIPCFATCTPAGGADEAMVVISPDYARGRTPDASEGAYDLRSVIADLGRDAERFPGRAGEFFAWADDEPLEVDLEPEIVHRLLGMLIEVANAVVPADGTAVLTARRDRSSEGEPVVLRLRAYAREVRPSILAAVETVAAEFGAAHRLPVEVADRDGALDVVVTLRRVQTRDRQPSRAAPAASSAFAVS